jgi:hypothetical protein
MDATACPANRLSIVKFNYLPVVHIGTERFLDRIDIGAQQPFRKISHETDGIGAGPLADKKGWDELGIGVDRHECPLIADLGPVGSPRTQSGRQSTRFRTAWVRGRRANEPPTHCSNWSGGCRHS